MRNMKRVLQLVTSKTKEDRFTAPRKIIIYVVFRESILASKSGQLVQRQGRAVPDVAPQLLHHIVQAAPLQRLSGICRLVLCQCQLLMPTDNMHVTAASYAR